MTTISGYMATMTVVDEVSPAPEKNFKVNAYTVNGRRKSLVGSYPNMINLDTARFENEDDVRERLASAIQSENASSLEPVERVEVMFEVKVCSANINTIVPTNQSYEIGEFNRD